MDVLSVLALGRVKEEGDDPAKRREKEISNQDDR